MVALFSAVLSRLASNAFALKLPLTEERLVCTIVGGARTDVIASQIYVAVQVPGQYTLTSFPMLWCKFCNLL